MRSFSPPPRRRILAGLALALLVQLGAVYLLTRPGRPAGLAVKPALVNVRLLAAKPSEPRPPERPLRALPSWSMPPAPPLAHGWPDLPQVAPASAQAAVPALPAPAPALTAAQPRPALNLALPAERAASEPKGESLRRLVREDPRSHSARRTLETVIADGAGTLPVTVGASTDGTQSKIVRQGSKCTRVSEARIATLNPMDENARATPGVSGACFKD